ncbi:MAG TPA: fumarylacetoacetate hydrolase family protein [Dehalococcoidia bacterium]|jgi:2-keto-4-pentenoate hydratase/2-oxohepta-3-ene-1,7-dioic acid hydratase in catechol pathway|nr:fumarylacetoacetate hydrolase family protein [Dehalococcoidia bacterium]
MKIVRFWWRDKVNWGILEDDTIFALNGDLYGDFEKGEEVCKLPDVRLLAPVEPSIMVACGRNYMDHIKEMGWAVPQEPSLFFKPANTVVGPEEDIIYPAVSRDLRYEAELCLVIKRLAKNVAEEEALDYVLGYTCGNDVTAIDLFEKEGLLARAKGFDTAGPLGPVLVIGLDPHNLAIKGRVNGVTRQDSNTSLMIFSVEKLISHISAFMTLRPGDVVWTGTPGGGACPIKVGDVIEVEIEGIGVLRNRVVAPK